MLDDPRSMEIVTWFFEQWIELDHLDHAEKDREVYPDWTDDRPASFREETLRFVRTVWEQEAASFETLLTADWTIADAELAEFYGYGSATSDWGRVSRDPAEHAGILTQGAFLASRARSTPPRPSTEACSFGEPCSAMSSMHPTPRWRFRCRSPTPKPPRGSCSSSTEQIRPALAVTTHRPARPGVRALRRHRALALP